MGSVEQSATTSKAVYARYVVPHVLSSLAMRSIRA
jgi:hypothetical protein